MQFAGQAAYNQYYVCIQLLNTIVILIIVTTDISIIITTIVAFNKSGHACCVASERATQACDVWRLYFGSNELVNGDEE